MIQNFYEYVIKKCQRTMGSFYCKYDAYKVIAVFSLVYIQITTLGKFTHL